MRWREQSGWAPRPGAETTPLVLTLTLRRDDPAGFDSFLNAVRNPGSPEYGRFLTPEQLADRFGPSRATYRGLVRWLEAQGLTVTERAKSRLTLGVRGRRVDVARALGVQIGDYRIGDRTFFANADDPHLPAALAAHVQSVTGLSDLARVQPVVKSVATAWNVSLCALLMSPIPPPLGYKVCNPEFANAYTRCVTAARAASANGTFFNLDYFFAQPYVTYAQVVLISENCPAPPPGGASAASAASVSAPRPRVASGDGQRVAIVGFDSFVRSDVADYLTLVGIPAANLDHLSQRARERRRAARARPGRGAARRHHRDDARAGARTSSSTTRLHGPGQLPGALQRRRSTAAPPSSATAGPTARTRPRSPTCRASTPSFRARRPPASASSTPSGDSGSTCLNGSPNTVAVPAGSPNATAVGGTSVQRRTASRTRARPGGTAPPRRRRPAGRLRRQPLLLAPELPGRLHAAAESFGARRGRSAPIPPRRDDLPGERRRLPDRRGLRRHEHLGAALGGLHGAPQPVASAATSASLNAALYPLAGTPRSTPRGSRHRLRARRPRLAEPRPAHLSS